MVDCAYDGQEKSVQNEVDDIHPQEEDQSEEDGDEETNSEEAGEEKVSSEKGIPEKENGREAGREGREYGG